MLNGEPGAPLVKGSMPFKFLAFTADELEQALKFVLDRNRCSGLAWGSCFYTTSEGERINVPNFQRHSSPESLWKSYEELCKSEGSFYHLCQKKYKPKAAQ